MEISMVIYVVAMSTQCVFVGYLKLKCKKEDGN